LPPSNWPTSSAGGAGVAVNAQFAAVELPDEQRRLAVAVEVADERGGVPAALDVDRLAVGGDLHRGREVRRQPRRPLGRGERREPYRDRRDHDVPPYFGLIGLSVVSKS
jgi:hypothetical protein